MNKLYYYMVILAYGMCFCRWNKTNPIHTLKFDAFNLKEA